MAAPLRIEVVYALPDRCWTTKLVLDPGATVADALAAAAMENRVPGLVVDPARLAVFGRSADPQSKLRDGDRVEILRPLLADPKQARRRRARETQRP